MKRKWREATPDGATAKTSKAAVGFQYCSKLFAKEKVSKKESHSKGMERIPPECDFTDSGGAFLLVEYL